MMRVEEIPPASAAQTRYNCQNWELFGRKVQGAERSHCLSLKPPNHLRKVNSQPPLTHSIPSTIP